MNGTHQDFSDAVSEIQEIPISNAPYRREVRDPIIGSRSERTEQINE